MSHSSYFHPIQKVSYKYVSGPDTMDQHSDNLDNNENYVKNQSEIIKLQNQEKIGTIPDHIIKYSNNDIIANLQNGGSSQIQQIQSSHKKTPPDEYHQYDPYYDYLNKLGLLNYNNKTRINTKTYSINSAARQTEPQIVTKNKIALESDALGFNTIDETIGVSTSQRDILTIYCPSHGVQKGDQITLSGVTTNYVSIKSIYNDINGDSKNAVIFTNYSTSVIFKCNFDTYLKDPNTGMYTSQLNSSMSFDPNFKITDGINYETLKNYDTSDMFVKLSGFDISPTGTPFLGNIPINFLNSTHRIYFTNPNYQIINGLTVYDPDTVINVPNSNGVVTKITGFYINLEIPFVTNSNTNYDNNNKNILNNQINTGAPMIINMDFHHIGGIPINKINAHYPIDNDNIKGSHEVYSVSENTINILLDKKTYYNTKFGGSEMELTVLEKVIKGFNSPNNYSIELPNTINNVVMAKLTSTIFSNTAKVFTSNAANKNNKLYWQNQDDGDFIYSIEISSGNYNPLDLQEEIQNKIYAVPRKYAINNNATTSYSDRISMSVIVSSITNNVTFTAFKEAVLKKPIQDITPAPPQVGDGDGSYTLTISQTGHGLFVGDSVTFAGFTATNGIPATVLNTSHVITSVPNNDTYTIQLSDFNLATGSRVETGGGFSTRVLVPCSFRLLFNYPDTMGKELGFRNVGKSSSITKFSKIIKNSDPYEGETIYIDNDGAKYINDSSGNKMPLIPNSLKLDGDDYVIMVIRKFDNIINISKNKNISSYFAKINLRGLPGTVVYDDFVSPPLIFHEPIELSQLDVSFYSSTGELYDFNGLEHSFTIEITNIEYLPEDTGIISTLSVF